MAVAGCGLASPDIRLPDLDRQSTAALLDAKQKAAAIESMDRLAKQQQQRAQLIEKKPLLSGNLERTSSVTR